MRFSGFDADTNKLLFDAYDEAMASLSNDPALSLDLIYRCQNVVAQRLTELATHGVRNRMTLRDAAMKVIFEARAAEEMQTESQRDGTGRIDSVSFGFNSDPRNHRQGENNE